jgi:hypothetical protein
MLSGTVPFAGETFSLVAAKIIQQEPIPLRALRADLPHGVVRAVEVAMRKPPEERPTMLEMKDLLLDTDAAPRAVLPELSISTPSSLRHTSEPHTVILPRPDVADPPPRAVTTTSATPPAGSDETLHEQPQRSITPRLIPTNPVNPARRGAR